jgi:hypothetical protein
MAMFTRDDILRGLRKIDAKARASGILVDLSIYGGAALAIAFDLRSATRDVDAVVHGAPQFLRKAASDVAEEEGWPQDWLNDGVKGFLSDNEQMSLMETFAAGPEGGAAHPCADGGVFLCDEMYGDAAGRARRIARHFRH